MYTYRKYPKTPALPYSKHTSVDDEWHNSIKMFDNKEVIISNKYDGEATTLYSDKIHARSIDSMHLFARHPSRTWVKALHAQIKHKIPPHLRICGENVYAYHSVFYPALPTYFFVYGVFDNSKNLALAWDDVVEIAKDLDLMTVHVLYRGIWDEKVAKQLWPFSLYGEAEAEGYVVRCAHAFPEREFHDNIAKFVRPNHCAKDAEHWLTRPVVPNRLRIENYYKETNTRRQT